MLNNALRLFLASLCIWPTSVLALDGGGGGSDNVTRNESFGSCSFLLISFQPAEAANISLFQGSTSLGVAGGSVYSAGIVVASTDISASDIESCGFSDVENIVQDGAETAPSGGILSNYAFDSEMSISFRATDDSDGNTYDYEFALRGQTNTQAVVTRTLVPPEPPVVPDEPIDQNPEDIQRPVAQFMEARAHQILSNQPELTRYLTDDQPRFSVGTLAGGGTFSFASGVDEAIWWDLQTSWSNQDELDTSFFMGSVGTHIYSSPNLLAGVMFSFDRTSSDSISTEVDGIGWMAGPYIVARLPEQPLFFEARALFGSSDNDITLDEDEGDFDTTRRLLQARVTGEIISGSTTLYPHFDYSRMEEDQDAFTVVSGLSIPQQSITVDQLTLGLDFSRLLEVNSGSLVLTGGGSAIFADVNGDGTPTGAISTTEEIRGRIDLGFTYAMRNASQISVASFFDGIGSDEFESFGLSMSWAMEF